MKQRFAIAAAAALVAAGVATQAAAQCAFEHPAKAKKFSSDLVQAMVSCGNPTSPPPHDSPNTSTTGGVDACEPVTTLNQSAGNPPNGWHFGPKGAGTLGFQADKNKLCTTAGAKPPCPPGDLNVNDENANCTAAATPYACCTGAGTGNCGSQDCVGVEDPYPCCTGAGTGTCGNVGRADLRVTLALKGIVNGADQPVGDELNPSNGTLITLARASLNDPVGGDMTVIDFPANFSISLIGGATKLKTTANALLNGIGQNALPKCTSIETVVLAVADENGTIFARPGIFLPKK